MLSCPVCSGSVFSVLTSAAELAREVQFRDRFISQRTTRALSPGERKDLTDFFHNENADLLACAACSLLVRSQQEDPPAEDYSQEAYDAAAIERVYPKYLRAFAAKEKPYRTLLPPGASIVELGSHYGAFLEVAERWGWKATGVDIGQDSTRFARSHGKEVRSCELGDCGFGEESIDGLFIWNCFDQIDEPRPVLAEARRLLKPSGILVVRTPSGLFYSLCRSLLQKPSLPCEAAQFLRDAMAYNNLLGFPYRYGYNRRTLEQLIVPSGFQFEGVLNSELITLPLPDDPEWVAAEARHIHEGVELLEQSVLRNGQGEGVGPWLEMWFRK